MSESPKCGIRGPAAKSRLATILWAIIIPLGLTALEWPFRGQLAPSNILMLYLLGVFFVAIRFGLSASVVASVCCAGSFAFFFAPPIYSFAISDRENLLGLTVMLVVGTVTSRLAENVRHQAEMAERGERRASALYHLSKELAEARSEREIVEIGIRHIHGGFALRSTLLLRNSRGLLSYPTDPPLAMSFRGAELSIARQVLSSATHAAASVQAFQSESANYLPINSAGGSIGVLAIESMASPNPFPPEQRQFLDSLLDQIAHALEKTRLSEQAQEATLKMQAEALRNSLLSSISHDLRTPLATIVGAASTLEEDALKLDDDRKQELASVIGEEARRMTDLTTKILEMARLESGEVVLSRQWCDPEEIIGSALRRLEKVLRDREVGIQLADSQALIYADSVLLQQVLVNLLDNAAKYSPADSPIDVAMDTSPTCLTIRVADRGPGISDEYLQKVFDKFFRVQAEGAQSGVGLGLSICRAIVEAHGGEIGVANRKGGGALFCVRLPIPESPPTIEPEEFGTPT